MKDQLKCWMLALSIATLHLLCSAASLAWSSVIKSSATTPFWRHVFSALSFPLGHAANWLGLPISGLLVWSLNSLLWGVLLAYLILRARRSPNAREIG